MKIFSPIKIGKAGIKNRAAMSPMDLGFAGPDGLVNDRVINFYAERAENDAGLIIVGGAYPQKGISAMSRVLTAHDNSVIPGFLKLNETLHQSGAKTALQLLHPGRYAHPIFNQGRQPVSSSAVRPTRIYPGLLPRALSTEEVGEVIRDFALAAKRAKDGGFDAVEIYAGMGFLISQFFSPAVNRRADRYGGSFENRARFACEIIENIKKVCGNDFPLIARIAGDEIMDGGNGLEECARIAAILENAGADAIAVTPGWEESRIGTISMEVPEASYLYMSKRIKNGLKIPLIAGVRIREQKSVEDLLVFCDMVGWGRPFIADPALVKKIREGETFTRCISCNYCLDEMLSLHPISCAVNPRVGSEGEIKITQAEKIKKVAVVGAGPAGLEAALTADLRGHTVHLFDQKNNIGGSIELCAAPPGRAENKLVVQNYEDRLKKSGVKLSLGVEMNPKTILSLNPDALIVASGAGPILPQLMGINLPHVCLAEDVLSGKIIPGKNVAVIGGGLVGCETALFTAKLGAMSPDSAVFLLNHGIINEDQAKKHTRRNGRQVTIVEKLGEVGRGFGKSSRWMILKEIEVSGIALYTDSEIGAILEDRVRIFHGKEKKELELKADTVIIAVGHKKNGGEFHDLEKAVPEVYFAGDCNEPGKIHDAVKSGYEIGKRI